MIFSSMHNFSYLIANDICTLGKDEDLDTHLKVRFAGLGLLGRDVGEVFLASRD